MTCLGVSGRNNMTPDVRIIPTIICIEIEILQPKGYPSIIALMITPTYDE